MGIRRVIAASAIAASARVSVHRGPPGLGTQDPAAAQQALGFRTPPHDPAGGRQRRTTRACRAPLGWAPRISFNPNHQNKCSAGHRALGLSLIIRINARLGTAH